MKCTQRSRANYDAVGCCSFTRETCTKRPLIIWQSIDNEKSLSLKRSVCYAALIWRAQHCTSDYTRPERSKLNDCCLFYYFTNPHPVVRDHSGRRLHYPRAQTDSQLAFGILSKPCPWLSSFCHWRPACNLLYTAHSCRYWGISIRMQRYIRPWSTGELSAILYMFDNQSANEKPVLFACLTFVPPTLTSTPILFLFLSFSLSLFLSFSLSLFLSPSLSSSIILFSLSPFFPFLSSSILRLPGFWRPQFQNG